MLSYILLSLVLIGVLVIGYAFLIESKWIEVNHYKITKNISTPLRIAHLSDLHIRALGYKETKIVALLKRENPDVIIITGDLVAENSNYKAVEGFLKKLHAPLGVWITQGNWEHWRPSDYEVYKSAGVNFLNNSAKQLKNEIWIAGIDDIVGDPDIKEAIKDIPKDAFIIGLIHSPAFFDAITSYFPLVFAGHTHGGQIRLPFIRPLWLPPGSGKYAAGWYNVKNSKMYVNKGLGTSVIDARLFCRPEIAIIELK